jgi:hypothetical protein
MTSVTPTLLDPFEVGAMRSRLSTIELEPPTEWFARQDLPLTLLHAAEIEEINEPPPWTPEPVDRRWRARCWTHDG